MAKIDKSRYTKEEWRSIREQRRQEKIQKRLSKQNKVSEIDFSFENVVDKKYNILCLKHGTKYHSDYVNHLYNMVERNCSLDYNFYCLTENPKGIDKNVNIIPLPAGLTGWWCKPFMFSSDLPIKGTVLYLDLDVVVAGNIDKLLTWQPDNWCTIRDFTRSMRPGWQKYNSSVVRFEAGSLSSIWENYKLDPKGVQRKFFGDQDWLYDQTHKNNPATLYPDSWITSWKWEVRKSRDLNPGTKGTRTFKHVEDVVPKPETSVCVFHGDPNPHNCKDPWVVDNWK